MEMKNTSCCALQEVVELREHPNAKAAMMAFCAQNLLPGKITFFSARNGDRAPLHGSGDNLFNFYLFTANVDGGNHYGQDFAKFILDNGLGTLVHTPPIANKAFHGGGACMAWLWTPDPKNLRDWYTKAKTR